MKNYMPLIATQILNIELYTLFGSLTVAKVKKR